MGFSHQDNKANLIANWLLAMFDATAKPVYRERAEKWFQVMKSRMKLKHDGTYEIWNYWEPAGAWDYKSTACPSTGLGFTPMLAITTLMSKELWPPISMAWSSIRTTSIV